MSWPGVGIFQALHSLKVMDAMNGSPDNGTPIIQWDQHGGNNQQFRIEPLGDNQFALRAVHSGKVLDVSGISRENGAQIHQWDWVGGNNQRWRIVLP